VLDEDLGLRGELHPAAALAQQGDARLTLQDGQLLRDGGGAVGECLGHAGDGAADCELAQEAQPAQVEHVASHHRHAIRRYSRRLSFDNDRFCLCNQRRTL
jgi:hypothetical protein